MVGSLKIRLLPTPEQRGFNIKHVGAMRFSYNWGIECSLNMLKTTL